MKRFQTPFFIGYLLFFLIGSFMLFISDKITLQLNTNALHTIFLDTTMPYITWMGDGLFAILVAVVILLFFHRRLGSLLLIGYAGSALLAQGAKRLLFPEAMRPYFFLKYHPSFHKIPHFLYYEFHSFPSGHTTTAFAMATVLAWHCSPSSWKQWALLMLACLVGFSRTYLSQHFLVDVLAGSMLGVCCGLMLVVFWPQHWLSKQTPFSTPMNLKTLGSIVGICLILFVPFLGYVHLFDWDEINFAECAREMLESGNFSTVTIDYEPFWEKPPLFIWMQALSMKCFGVHAFGARFPNVLAAIATLLSILYHGTKHQNRKFALWWAAFYLGSFLPNLYFHSGIIDPWFNLFILNAIAFYFSGNTHRNHLHWLLCGIFAGLAVMTKGPVALILVGGSVFFYHLITRFKGFPSLKALVLVLFSTLVISLCWFFMLWVTGNTAIIEQFLAYQVRLFQTQDAGHGGPIYYHWVVLLLGCFPASFFALSSLFKKTTYANRFSILILISGLLTLVLFSIVQTKIIHYSSFCYFFLCYFAALAVAQEQPKLTRTVLFAGVYLGAIAMLVGVLVYLQTYGPGIEKVLTIQDPFALQNLKAYTQWRWYDFTVVVLWLGAVIVSFYYAWKKRLTHAVGVLLLGIALGNVALKPTLLPHIEQYTQGAAIAFYEKHRDQNVYLITLGYKSYAHLFYGKIKPHTNPLRYNEAWVCADSTDLPAFYVARYPSQERYLQAYPNLKMLYMKHGFVFLAQKKNLSLKSQKK